MIWKSCNFGRSGESILLFNTFHVFCTTWKARKAMFFSQQLSPPKFSKQFFSTNNILTTFHQDVNKCPNKRLNVQTSIYKYSKIAYMFLFFSQLFSWWGFLSIQHPTGPRHLEKELIMGRGRDPSLPWKVWRSTSSWRASKNLETKSYRCWAFKWKIH